VLAAFAFLVALTCTKQKVIRNQQHHFLVLAVVAGTKTSWIFYRIFQTLPTSLHQIRHRLSGESVSVAG